MVESCQSTTKTESKIKHSCLSSYCRTYHRMHTSGQLSLHHKSSTVAEPTSTTTPKDDSRLITTSGKVIYTSFTRNSNEWIIDSGVTDHMTFDNLCLQYLKPSEQHIISTTNGTPSHVIGEGSVILTE